MFRRKKGAWAACVSHVFTRENCATRSINSDGFTALHVSVIGTATSLSPKTRREIANVTSMAHSTTDATCYST